MARPKESTGIPKIQDYLDERDMDLYNAYQETIKEFGHLSSQVTKRLLIEETLKKPAPRFYVSPTQASRIISNLIKGNSPEQGRSCKK